MASTAASSTFKDLGQKVLLANKDHQYSLRVYTERLEAELETVDKLLAAIELPEDELDVDVGGAVVIPDAAKAVGPLPNELSFEESPFADDAARRRQYMKATEIHPMKTPELEALSDAVQAENHRLLAIEAQRRGQQPFIGLDEYPSGFLELNKVGLNWDRIASKVSRAGVAYVQRTAEDCEIRWLADRHPEFDHSPWSKAEVDRIQELVGDAKEGEVDWVDIAAKLGTNRTPVDCMRNAIPRKTHNWTPEADQRLLEAVQVYGCESWLIVARQVSEHATAAQCQARYSRSLDPSIRRGPWSAEEDAQLKRAVEVFGRAWTEICLWVPGRSNEQCRERHQEIFNPPAKGRWTEHEDQALLDAIERCGPGKWKAISQLVGRSDNTCRSRYTLLTKRKAKAEAASLDASVSAPVDVPPADETFVQGPSQRRHRKTARRVSEGQTQPNDFACTDDAINGPIDDVPVKPKPRTRAKKQATTLSETPADADAEQPTAGPDEAGPSAPTPQPKPRPVRRRKVDLAAPPVILPLEAHDGAQVALDPGADPQPLTASTFLDTGEKSPIPPKRGRGRPRTIPKEPAPDVDSSTIQPPTAKRRKVARDPKERAEVSAEPLPSIDTTIVAPSEERVELTEQRDDGVAGTSFGSRETAGGDALVPDTGPSGGDQPQLNQEVTPVVNEAHTVALPSVPRRGRGGQRGRGREPARRSTRRQAQT